MYVKGKTVHSMVINNNIHGQKKLCYLVLLKPFKDSLYTQGAIYLPDCVNHLC